MLEHVLSHLAGHGIDDVVLSMGYQPDRFTDRYPSGTCAGVTLHYAVEPEPLDTAGAVRFAALDAGIDSRFVVVNGDVLTDLDVTALIGFHEEHGAEGTIALHKVEDPSAFGVVPTDGDGKVQAFVEKPPRDEAPTDLINAGTYVLEPSVLDRIEPGRKVSIEREVFPAMVADGTLYAMPGDTYWIDTGTPALYLRAQLDLLDGARGEPVDGIDPRAQVAESATVVRSVVADGAVIGDGAEVRESVVMGGARIGPGASLQRSIVGYAASIGAEAHLVDAVVGDRIELDAGAYLVDARIPEADAG
jgi:mannose-1-phosphate guanylyltransferase